MNKNIDTVFYKCQAEEFLGSYEFDKAGVIYKRLIGIDPKCNDHHYCWALVLGDQEKYGLSELKFREVLAYNSEDHGALNSLGIIFLKQGKYDEAISAFQRAFKIHPQNTDLPLNMAIAFTKKGDYEEAIGWYGKALKATPSDVSTHNCMGFLYFLQYKFQEAIMKFDDAIQIDPHYEIPYFNKAIALSCCVHMEEPSDVFRLGIQALTGGNPHKLHRLKISVKNYNSELNRVQKELECDDLIPEFRLGLEKIQKGCEFVLGLLAIEIEKLEDD